MIIIIKWCQLYNPEEQISFATIKTPMEPYNTVNPYIFIVIYIYVEEHVNKLEMISKGQWMWCHKKSSVLQ